MASRELIALKISADAIRPVGGRVDVLDPDSAPKSVAESPMESYKLLQSWLATDALDDSTQGCGIVHEPQDISTSDARSFQKKNEWQHGALTGSDGLLTTGDARHGSVQSRERLIVEDVPAAPPVLRNWIVEEVTPSRKGSRFDLGV